MRRLRRRSSTTAPSPCAKTRSQGGCHKVEFFTTPSKRTGVPPAARPDKDIPKTPPRSHEKVGRPVVASHLAHCATGPHGANGSCSRQRVKPRRPSRPAPVLDRKKRPSFKRSGDFALFQARLPTDGNAKLIAMGSKPGLRANAGRGRAGNPRPNPRPPPRSSAQLN